MASPIKYIISSRKNLEKKYGKNLPEVLQLLSKLVTSDKVKNLDTRILFIDDTASAKSAGIKPVASASAQNCKKAVDALYNVCQPAYMVILGAQDVFPFQTITNPVSDGGDDDKTVPSDLPYACSAPYGKKLSAFTGPSRVVGRIPDVPGSADINYLQTLINNIIKYNPVTADQYKNYFAVTAVVWEQSTRLNLQGIFGNSENLLKSPPAKGKYAKDTLKPLMHLYNCHGALVDSNYYGQKGDTYPVSLNSSDLNSKISYGTVVAAECCYGAQMFKSSAVKPESLSISNNYLLNNALAFLGSSTIAYGESASLANADLMTQYFLKNILNGASAGRALLEARQKFLTNNGPQLDPYEQKTLAQYYLLGDPSIQPVLVAGPVSKSMVPGNTIQNRRLTLFNKGMNLKETTTPSEHTVLKSPPKHSHELKQLFTQVDFSGKEKQSVYTIKPKTGAKGIGSKSIGPGSNVRYRAFVKSTRANSISQLRVLVVKEDSGQLLGWKVYQSK